MTREAWSTDAALRTAYLGFVERTPGFVLPVAYGVALERGGVLTFGHVNGIGAVRPLPAVVLAHVCGYADTTKVVRFDSQRMAQAIDLLAPAEAATHMPHPNLWSWRQLLEDAAVGDDFVAFFLSATDDRVIDERDREFRTLIDS